ncbi:LGFP repeat-containing protein [Agromyces sp. S2-1-8]|uniref:LGFP repeat-containing protein n=1 Tax=Agromyces sp. S2-1-8 TaxID=2897180 RepID=UPI001E512A8C|nr:hypothetical protein [Agromyces sp. S2-1-8]MCD5347789.1 hypothetical protein [Agromyces sp. S2-1-8]
MRTGLKRRMLAVVTALVLAVGLATADGIADEAPATAAVGSAFNPGMIISDAVFYNSGTMTAAQIQSFLNAKVPTCRSGYVCLKSYRQTTTSQPARSEGCSAYAGQANETAALIIYKVARACGINPQSLLVLLEKEQGLVTDTWPTSRQYRSATGYGCPDTADCDINYYGFFNQLYNAAWQFKKYRARPDRAYRAGRYNTIQWHPNSACGTSQVYIQNQATAGLYLYTPYRPNAAALQNLYGTGDGCSSYGNRNFWRMFTDWFGSTGGYTVDPNLLSLYNSTGGATGILGPATDKPVHYADGGAGQEFQRGWAYWHSTTGAFRTAGTVGRSYITLKGPTGVLGYPLSNPKSEPLSGASQRFQKGSLYYSPTTKIHIVSGKILTSYTTLKGPSGVLGFPVYSAIAGPNGGFGQQFQYGWLYTSPTTSIHRVSGAIAKSYQALKGPAGILGYPIAAQKSAGDGWVSQAFQKGVLYYSPSGGVHYVLTKMQAGYALAGGVTGALGAPVDSTKTYGSGLGQQFQKGWLYWGPDTGFVRSWGAIGKSYAALKGPSGLLGFPVSTPKTAANGWTTQTFQKGLLYYSSSYGIHYVLNTMNAAYVKAGGLTGKYGIPRDSTKSYADGGFGQWFSKAWVYVSSKGVGTTTGVLGTSHWKLGGGGGVLGYPTAAQKSEPGSGLSQQFTGGGLYYSPKYSIHYVRSTLNTEYLRRGGVSGSLGHPLGSTLGFKGGYGQRFVNASLYWSEASGYQTTSGVIATSYSALGGPDGVLGYPVAPQRKEPGGGLSQEFQKGWLIWSPSSGIDRIARPIGEYYFQNGGTEAFGYPKNSTVSKTGGVLEQEFAKVRLRWTSTGGVVKY